MQLDPTIQRLLDETNSTLSEYRQYRNSPSEPIKRGQTRARLQELEADLNRIRRLQDQAASDSRRQPKAMPSPLDAEIRRALREMPPAERERLVSAREPSVLNALKTAPCWLSGIEPARLKKLEEEELVSMNKDLWEQQAVDSVGLQGLEKSIKNGLRQLFEGSPT
ncbi:MAG TPA: hypothetical protein VKB96_00150 [Gammaproteobacteria bacterium]|nr:hypothetical protein [Gammaproteobacteria bacterium]